MNTRRHECLPKSAQASASGSLRRVRSLVVRVTQAGDQNRRAHPML